MLARPDVARRPGPAVWSPLEYACHVRDVHVLFDQRVRADARRGRPRLRQLGPGRHGGRAALRPPGPRRGRRRAGRGGRRGSRRRTARCPVRSGSRRGRRSNGSVFTVESLGRYHLHDVVHHLWDVGFDPAAATVAAYDVSAAEYAAGTADLSEHGAAAVTAFARRLPPGARVLEIGSGGGRDALAPRGRRAVRPPDRHHPGVRRAAAVRRPRRRPRSTRCTTTWPTPSARASRTTACGPTRRLLHVGRADLPVVLARLAEVTRPGGVLRLTVKEGDGETWSTHGNVSAPRRFTFWREGPLRRCARPGPAGTCSSWCWPRAAGRSRGSSSWRSGDEAHRVLGPARARAGRGLRPELGQADGDHRARRPDRRRGARRGRAAQAGLGRRLAEPGAAGVARSEPGTSRQPRRRSRPAPHDARRWSPGRWSARSASRSASPPRRCWPTTCPAPSSRPASRRPARCSAPRVAAYLLARLMSRRGRRAGLTLGYLLGAAGAVVVVAAGAVELDGAAAGRRRAARRPRPRPTPPPATPPPTSPPRRPAAARCRWWCGRPRSAPCSGPT